MPKWRNFDIKGLKKTGMCSSRFQPGLDTIERAMPEIMEAMRKYIAGGRRDDEFKALTLSLQNDLHKIYGKTFQEEVARTRLTLGSGDLAQTGTFRLIGPAHVANIESDILLYGFPQQVFETHAPAIGLADTVQSILDGNVDAVFVNGSGNNMLEAVRSAGGLSALRNGKELNVMHHYFAADAPRDWGPQMLFQLAEKSILLNVVIAAATSAMGENGVHVPIFAHSAGSVVAGFAARILGDDVAKDNIRVVNINAGSTGPLFLETYLAKHENPESHIHISAQDVIGVAAILNTIIDQRSLSFYPKPDVKIPTYGHSFSTGFDYLGQIIDHVGAPFLKLNTEMKLHPSSLSTIRNENGHLKSIDPSGKETADGGFETFEAHRKEVEKSVLPGLEEFSKKEKERKKDRDHHNHE
jgi:hypothetical protein